MTSDCQQVRELMDSYLSGELSVETNHLVLGHLDACQACRTEVNRRQRLRSILKQTLDTPVDADRVRQRIVQAIDRERSWAWRARWAGVAAALLVSVGAIGLWLSRPVDTAAYEDSAENHVACALAFPDVTYDPERAARSLVPQFEHIADMIGLTHGEQHVVDAHMCPFKGREYVHVVFRGGGQTRSLFVEPDGRGALPATPRRVALDDGALDVFSIAQSGYVVSATATRSHRLFVVTDWPTEQPDATTSGILRSTAKFVRTLER